MRDRPPSRGVPVDRVRGEEPPERADWRDDPRGRSDHGRVLDHLREPAEEHDPAKAGRLCAEISRLVLRDFAPALVLLPRARRARLQALVAYAATLFDFAGQRGVEGELLSELNRWEFSLERALDGDPPGQPVFVRLALEEEREPWRREGFDRLGEVARRRALGGRPETPERAEVEADAIGAALVAPLLPPGETAEALGRLAGALVRLRGLQDLGPALATRRTRLPRTLLPDAWEREPREPGRADPDARDPGRGGPDPARRDDLEAAVAAECAAIRPRLNGAARALAELPPADRRAVIYLLLAGQRLLVEVEEKRRAVAREPPEIGAWARLGLVLRARFLGLR